MGPGLRSAHERLRGGLVHPGLTGGTAGTGGLPPWKEWIFQRVGFPVMVWLGYAQWPESAARKCADALEGRVGRHGDLLGAPEGTALGPITDQKPMAPAFSNVAMQEAVWRMAEEVGGPVCGAP